MDQKIKLLAKFINLSKKGNTAQKEHKGKAGIQI